MTRRLRLPRERFFVGLLLVAPLLAVPSSASASALEHVSIGPNGGNAALDATYRGSSADGARAFFVTTESLVSADSDNSADVYQRSGGVTTLVSTGITGGNGAFGAIFAGASQDGTRVFFETSEKLVSGDTDGSQDVYERSSGTTTLVSTAPAAGNGPFSASFAGASQDGTHVFFETSEKLMGGDTDSSFDIYERSGGTTTLVSTGPTGGNGAINAIFDGSSADGSRIFFDTKESLVATDTDASEDVYQRAGGTTTLLSIGPSGGNGAFDVFFDGNSADGTSVFFETSEKLVSADTDSSQDIYERVGGTTTLVSVGSSGGNGLSDAFFDGNSADGSRVFFETDESLVAADTDSRFDIYQRSSATTTLLSIGASGGNGAFDVFFDGNSADGTHVFFDTDESLVTGDADTAMDIYDHSGSATTLVSTGPSGGNGSFLVFFDGTSTDGTHAFFDTDESLVSEDTDTFVDLYDRSGGITQLVSAGAAGGNGTFDVLFGGNSADGRRAFFMTHESLLRSDTDSSQDVYAGQAAHQHPQSAPSIGLSLVPLFKQCGTVGNTANSSHAAPLTVGSCGPPAPIAGVVAYFGSQAAASAQMTVIPGNLTTLADEADVSFQLNATDIRSGNPNGADYNPNVAGADLTAIPRLRVTDTANGSSLTDPATTTDLDFPLPVDCVGTGGPEGATCSANTSADAVIPGAIKEGKESVIQVFRLRVTDSGPNGARGDSDDKLFAQEGVFIP